MKPWGVCSVDSWVLSVLWPVETCAAGKLHSRIWLTETSVLGKISREEMGRNPEPSPRIPGRAWHQRGTHCGEDACQGPGGQIRAPANSQMDSESPPWLLCLLGRKRHWREAAGCFQGCRLWHAAQLVMPEGAGEILVLSEYLTSRSHSLFTWGKGNYRIPGTPSRTATVLRRRSHAHFWATLEITCCAWTGSKDRPVRLCSWPPLPAASALMQRANPNTDLCYGKGESSRPTFRPSARHSWGHRSVQNTCDWVVITDLHSLLTPCC